MASIADDQRRRTRDRVLALPVRDRIALALALGDDDLALFVRASGLGREPALARLGQRRRQGRVASGCADGRVP
jgi:hypothetical protein